MTGKDGELKRVRPHLAAPSQSQQPSQSQHNIMVGHEDIPTTILRCNWRSSSSLPRPAQVKLKGPRDPNRHRGHPLPDGTVWVGEARSDDPEPDSPIPTATIFSEGNGGEFRKSFHGYGAPYAQLIASPRTWSMMPMQIDTKNREPGETRARDRGPSVPPDCCPGVGQAQREAPPCPSPCNLRAGACYLAQGPRWGHH